MTRMTKSLRLRSLALTLALVGTAVAFVVTTAASGAPAGGAIRVLSTGSGTGASGKVLITGAIGDAGTTLTINKAGKPTPNGGGAYVKVTLTKGTFELNIAKINASANKMFSSAKPNPATCSIGVVFGGPATLFNGTGLYSGITGTVRFTVSVGLIFPRLTTGARKGQCNLSNSARPTASLQVVEGTGTVNFA